MRTITKEIYKFEELTDTAKEKARERYRSGNEFIINNAKEIALIFGLEIDKIYYPGFYSQGDGACFEGSYQYKKGALKAVKTECPNDTELHRIVEQLQYEQARYFFAITADIKHRGRYYHSGCMSIYLQHVWCNNQDVGDFNTGLFRNFADWIYKKLEDGWDYQNSDESIICNGYEFTEDGDRWI